MDGRIRKCRPSSIPLRGKNSVGARYEVVADVMSSEIQVRTHGGKALPHRCNRGSGKKLDFAPKPCSRQNVLTDHEQRVAREDIDPCVDLEECRGPIMQVQDRSGCPRATEDHKEILRTKSSVNMASKICIDGINYEKTAGHAMNSYSNIATSLLSIAHCASSSRFAILLRQTERGKRRGMNLR